MAFCASRPQFALRWLTGGNRRRFEAMASGIGPPMGILASMSGGPVGWCACGPRSRYAVADGGRSSLLQGLERKEDEASGCCRAFHANEIVTPAPGYQKYKDDDLGHWYGAMCTSANWPDQNDAAGFTNFALQFFKAHPEVYVPAGQTPPQLPVPPALLRDIAIKNLKLPDPVLDWNPKIRGTQGTLVNLDTWFWLDHPPATLVVYAAAGGNEASVTAAFAGVDITAPGEAPLSCTGPGTAYTRRPEHDLRPGVQPGLQRPGCRGDTGHGRREVGRDLGGQRR